MATLRLFSLLAQPLLHDGAGAQAELHGAAERVLVRERVELVGDGLQVREVLLGERKLALDGGAAVVGFEEAEQEPADRGLVALARFASPSISQWRISSRPASVTA